MITDTKLPLRGQILAEAAEITLKSRNATYGDVSTNLTCRAELIEVYRKYADGKYDGAHEQAIENLLVKVARIASGSPGHRDNYVDGAAYMAIAFECYEAASVDAKLRVVKQNMEAALAGHFAGAILHDYQELKPGKLHVLEVDDPINRDTALPETPERTVEDHTPKLRKMKKPVIPKESENTCCVITKSDGRKLVIAHGDYVHFGVNPKTPWCVIGMKNSNEDLTMLTVYHPPTDRTVDILARHVDAIVDCPYEF